MAIWYVRTTGSDSAAGTSAATAFLTIGKAMTQASLAAGDTIYVGAGTYRVSTTIAPTSMASMTYLYGDTDGSKTGDAGEIVVTNYGTDDSTAPNTIACWTFASKSYWTLGNLTIVAGGSNNAFAISGTSANLVFQDCSIFADAAGFNVTDNFGVVSAITISRCRIVSGAISSSPIMFAMPVSATGADVNIASSIENCVIISNGRAAIGATAGTTNTYKTGGLTISNCLLLGQTVSNIVSGGVYAGQYVSTTYPVAVYNSLVISATALNTPTVGTLIENYNVLVASVPRTNVTAGANSVSNYSRSWRYSLGHEFSYGGVTRSFGEFPAQSPLLTWGGTSVPANDINGVTRPASGASQSSTQQALGPFERSNSGTKDSTTYRSAAPSLLITGPGYHDFELPVTGSTATTFTAYVYRDANYTGTNPSISVLNGGECGVADATATDTGSASAWNLLTLTFTPTSDGIVTIRFRSSSTAATGKAWIDDMAA